MSFQEELIIKKQKRSNPFVVREGKFKGAALEDSVYQLDWAEASFLSGNHEKEMLRRTFDLSKLKYVIGLMSVFMLVLGARVFWLQVVKGEYYYSMAEGNRIKSERIEPRRGIIYDHNLRPLVRNEANFVLYLIPNQLPRNDQDLNNLLRRVSLVLDRPATSTNSQVVARVGDLKLIPENPAFYELREQVAKVNVNSLEAYQPLFIADNLDYDRAVSLYLDLNSLPGVFISNKIRRNYLLGFNTTTPMLANGPSGLSHILGYTGKINENELKEMGSDYSLIDYIGKTGIELSYEKYLKGKNGEREIEVDALGREKKIVSQTAPEDGRNLLLTIDFNLQSQVEDLVKNYLQKIGKARASVILSDPQTGGLLTLISWPAYDNNVFAKGVSQADYQKFLEDKNRPLFNRAVSGEFPSGSTIKVVMSAIALEEKIINEFTSVSSVGGIHINQWVFPDWKAGGHGATNVKKAIAESVNTFFYYIGGGFESFKGLGIEKMVEYLAKFGLGETLGIDLPSEGTGFLPTPDWKIETKKERWYIGDTYHVAIGQGDLLVTPLQVAAYTGFFANGGQVYAPRVVDKILDSNNEVVETVPTKVVRQDFIDPKNIEIVRAGMRQTITSGSARALNSYPFEIAGKTGTAQWSSRYDHQAWFTGFAPYKDPEIVVTVLIEEGGEGSSVAAPLAGQILDLYFKYQASSTPAVSTN